MGVQGIDMRMIMQYAMEAVVTSETATIDTCKRIKEIALLCRQRLSIRLRFSLSDVRLLISLERTG